MRFFNRLFDIRSDEWPRFLFIYFIYLNLSSGLFMIDIIVEAAFLKHVGVEYLPGLIMASGFFSIIAIFFYTAFADRLANDKLLMVIFFLTILCIIIAILCLQYGYTGFGYLWLYLTANIIGRNIINVHWPLYVMGFYDTRSAKRIMPVLASSARISGIISGLSVPVLNHFLSPQGFVYIWLGTVAVNFLLLVLTPYIFKGSQQPKIASDQDKILNVRKSMENIKEGFQFVGKSSFLKWLALSTLSVMILLAYVNYQVGKIMLTELKTIENISNFTALLNTVSSVLLLPFQLFFANRMIARIGLGNASLVFPSLTVICCMGLFSFPTLITAAFGHLDRFIFRTAIYNPIDSLLYNAFPSRIKARARAFVGGCIVPLGSLIGGGLLYLPLAFEGIPSWLIPVFMMVLAGVYLIFFSAWGVRRHYSKAMVALLEEEDFSSLLSRDASDLAVADPTILKYLQGKLEASLGTNPEMTLLVAHLISDVAGDDALPILSRAAQSTSDVRTRSKIVDIVAAGGMRGEASYEFLKQHLTDAAPEVRKSSFIGMEELVGPGDKRFLSLAVKMLDDPDKEVQSRALAALAKNQDFNNFPRAVQCLEDLLGAEAPSLKAQGVRTLSSLCLAAGSEEALRRLNGFLNDPSDEIRLEAALGLEALFERRECATGLERAGIQPESMARLLKDPVERVRHAALTIMGHRRTPQIMGWVKEMLTDPSAQIRETAIDVAVRSGSDAVSVLQPELNSSDPATRKMAAIVLSRINPNEYGSLVKNQIKDNARHIYLNYEHIEKLQGHEKFKGLALLKSALNERSRNLLDEIFYLLGISCDSKSLSTVRNSLRSRDERVRANAAEAFESLTSPQTADLLVPLCDGSFKPEQVAALGQKLCGLEPCDATQILRHYAAHPDDPWLRTIAAYGLGEIGLALGPPPSAAPGEKESGRRNRKEGLGLLSGLAQREPSRERPAVFEGTPKPTIGEGSRRRRAVSSADLFGKLAGKDEPGKPRKFTGVEQEKEAGAPVLGDAPGEPAKSPAANVGKLLDDGKISSEKDTGVTQPIHALLPAMPEIRALLQTLESDPADEVQQTARAALQKMASQDAASTYGSEGSFSLIERILFLKDVPFFREMPTEQLRRLAGACDERHFPKDTSLFKQGDPGGVLYVVIKGRVGIEQEKRKGSFARLATVEAHSPVGDADLFDGSPRSTSALALQDTLVLRLRGEPVMDLARQHPDLALELVTVLSVRLREANDRVGELTRSKPSELHKLFGRDEQNA